MGLFLGVCNKENVSLLSLVTELIQNFDNSQVKIWFWVL